MFNMQAFVLLQYFQIVFHQSFVNVHQAFAVVNAVIN